MSNCINCGKKPGMRNPEYFLNSEMTISICDECYRKLEHFHIKLATGDLQEFDEDWKKVEEEMELHQFNIQTKMLILEYMQKQRDKLMIVEFKQRKQQFSLEDAKNLKTTTGYNFDGYVITDYLGVVSGESALGAGAFSGIQATVSNITGTDSSYFGQRLVEAKENAMRNLIFYSLSIGANAVIGMDFDYITINGLIVVIANGTAVKIIKNS